MTSSYISLQILPEKGSLGIHYFISKHDCFFEPLVYVMGEWVVLGLFLILFIKSELHCRCFAPLCNPLCKSQIIEYFVLQTNLCQTGA